MRLSLVLLAYVTTLKNYDMSRIKERIFANWKTTTLGIAVLIAGLVLVYLDKASLDELTAFITGALVLLISKDGK